MPCNIKSGFDTEEADAVVVQPHLLSKSDYLDVKIPWPHKKPHQLFVSLSYEHPVKYPIQLEKEIHRHVDLYMNFSLKSDVPISLVCPFGGGDITQFKAPFVSEQKGEIVGIFSKCEKEANERFRYLSELMQHLNIDFYGECLNNKGVKKKYYTLNSQINCKYKKKGKNFTLNSSSTHAELIEKKKEVYSKYKFVLAFETAEYEDFVSSKLVTALQAAAVPIYWGTSRVDPLWVPGPRSIIIANDFKGSFLTQFFHRIIQSFIE